MKYTAEKGIANPTNNHWPILNRALEFLQTKNNEFWFITYKKIKVNQVMSDFVHIFLVSNNFGEFNSIM